MRLADLPLVVIEDMKRTWRRRLIAGAIVLFFGIAAIIETIDATRIALASAVGPVWARLILVGVFILIGAAAVGFVLWAERQRRAAQAHAAAASDAAEAAAPPPGNEKIAMLAEAVHLGYSLARRLRKRPARRARSAKETPRAEGASAEPDASAAATGQP
jgi:type VI protein secretion system component VasK